MIRKLLSIVSLLIVAASCTANVVDDPTDTVSSELSTELRPNGKSGGVGSSGSRAGSTAIQYHGGPVIHDTTNVYLIWYGNWSGNTAPTILTDLVSNIGGSSYFNINTTYYDSTSHVSNKAHYAGSATDSYSKGTSLSDADIASIVTNMLSSNVLPTDLNGIYFVLTSADVHEKSGFCTTYCGWHDFMTTSNIKYAFVGNPDQCPSACEAQATGPNGNAGADGMASIIAHELEESVTDPNLNAWYDHRGYENADKCAWTFGTTYKVSNGSKANMKLGTRDFLIQQNWVNSGSGFCALHL